MTDPDFIVYVCPVCDNLSAYGKASDLSMQLDAKPWCHGSDAPGYPGSHEATAMAAVEVVRATASAPAERHERDA
jgi:hypothetical protein